MDKKTANKLTHDDIGLDALYLYDIAYREDGNSELCHKRIVANNFIDALEYVKRQNSFNEEIDNDIEFVKVEELDGIVSVPYETFLYLEEDKKKYLDTTSIYYKRFLK